MRQIGGELVGELEQVLPRGGRGLQFLGHISGLLTDCVDVMGIQRKTAYLDGACRQGYKTFGFDTETLEEALRYSKERASNEE